MNQGNATPRAHTNLNVDLTRIDNAEVRRALRQLVQQLQETLNEQQVELEAMLEIMLDKHLTSMGEFKRHAQLVRQRMVDRNDRLHSQVMQAVRDTTHSLEVSPREIDVPEEEGRQVYKL